MDESKFPKGEIITKKKNQNGISSIFLWITIFLSYFFWRIIYYGNRADWFAHIIWANAFEQVFGMVFTASCVAGLIFWSTFKNKNYPNTFFRFTKIVAQVIVVIILIEFLSSITKR